MENRAYFQIRLEMCAIVGMDLMPPSFSFFCEHIERHRGSTGGSSVHEIDDGYKTLWNLLVQYTDEWHLFLEPKNFTKMQRAVGTMSGIRHPVTSCLHTALDEVDWIRQSRNAGCDTAEYLAFALGEPHSWDNGHKMG
jgi:hypothetical protein